MHYSQCANSSPILIPSLRIWQIFSDLSGKRFSIVAQQRLSFVQFLLSCSAFLPLRLAHSSPSSLSVRLSAVFCVSLIKSFSSAVFWRLQSAECYLLTFFSILLFFAAWVRPIVRIEGLSLLYLALAFFTILLCNVVLKQLGFTLHLFLSLKCFT